MKKRWVMALALPAMVAFLTPVNTFAAEKMNPGAAAIGTVEKAANGVIEEAATEGEEAVESAVDKAKAFVGSGKEAVEGAADEAEASVDAGEEAVEGAVDDAEASVDAGEEAVEGATGEAEDVVEDVIKKGAAN